MRKSAWLLAVVVLAVPVTVEGQDDDRRLLHHLKEVEWPRAYLEQDTAALARILAPEFRRIDGEGNWFTRDDELRRVAAGPPGYDSLVFAVARLEVWANGTALVAGTGRVFRTSGSAVQVTTYQSTNVLVLRDGRWQAVASHTSGARPEA
jgi:hypothetical protein